jgi:hypothetical protein
MSLGRGRLHCLDGQNAAAAVVDLALHSALEELSANDLDSSGANPAPTARNVLWQGGSFGINSHLPGNHLEILTDGWPSGLRLWS